MCVCLYSIITCLCVYMCLFVYIPLDVQLKRNTSIVFCLSMCMCVYVYCSISIIILYYRTCSNRIYYDVM